MNHLNTHKKYLSELSREELESVALGLATVVSMHPPVITLASFYTTFMPDGFKDGTLEGVKEALKYIHSVGTKIRQDITESN